MIRETTLEVDDLIYPLFVIAGESVKNPVSSMPGVYQLSVDEMLGRMGGSGRMWLLLPAKLPVKTASPD